MMLKVISLGLIFQSYLYAYVSCHGYKVEEVSFRSDEEVILRQDHEDTINIYFEEDAKAGDEEIITLEFGKNSLTRDYIVGYKEKSKATDKALKYVRSDLDSSVFTVEKLVTRVIEIEGKKNGVFQKVELEMPASALALDLNSQAKENAYQTKALLLNKYDLEKEYLVVCFKW